MKFVAIACLLSLLAPATQGLTLSPVTRVVELLKGLSAQAEKEGKVEEGLYEDFVCWGKSIINQKTESNAAANSRIEELEAYIADLENGRVEFTSERADLEKEIAELMSDMETSTANRKKEEADYDDASDEMTKAINALDSAIKTLDGATKDHKEGVLLAVRASLKGAASNGGMAALAQQQAELKQAAELGERFLAKADAMFLKRVLLGEVPKVDWKKLNRKATFKMSYKARSFKIQDVLKKMHQTFQDNLADAQSKETGAISEYDKLQTSKGEQLTAARDALNKGASESGANGMSKQESQDELKNLQNQVGNDENFIKETKKSLDEKKASWKVRSDLRAGEIAAISKAISILHNDDARDLFKKSFDSQFFLQVAQTAQKAMTQKAAIAIRDAARRSGDQRLLALAARLSAPIKGAESHDSVKGKFDPIISAIVSMITALKGEEETDLETKQTCESERMENTRKAILLSRGIDEATELITKLTARIAECKSKIAELQADHTKTTEELAKAQKMRNDERTAWEATDADDKLAAETVMKARDVLASFYKDNDLDFLQKGKQPVSGMAAGDAPPPPPQTWGGDYGGKTGESQGILAIMDMVHEDIKKDRADAKKDEDTSDEEFNNFKKDSEAKMTDLKDEEGATTTDLGNAEQRKADTELQRNTDKVDGLDTILKKIKDIDPNCEYYEVNYPMRRENRQIEIDGLNKAKAILEGGVFDAPDPNREIKPGDAVLLQRRK